MTFAANGPVSAMNGPESGWTVAHGRAGPGCPCSAWSGSTNNACTTVIDLREAGGDYDVAALRIRGEHMLTRLRDTVIRAHELGVAIVTGGDTGYGPNSLTRIGQEMTHFVEMGFKPLEAIQAATIRNAEMLRLEKSIGSIESGFEADLIAVEKNPIDNITTVQDPLLVISNGRIALDRLEFGRRAGPL